MTRENLRILRNHLAKVRVAGSSPVARSERKRRSGPFLRASTCYLGTLGNAPGREQAAEISSMILWPRTCPSIRRERCAYNADPRPR
jgi:hypothetical protein